MTSFLWDGRNVMLMEDVAGYPIERMRELVSRLRHARDRRSLAEALKPELERLHIDGLQVISAAMEREINQLPSPYRERVRPHLREQFFGRYFKILAMNGKIAHGSLRDPDQYEKYLDTMATMGDDARTWESVKEMPQYTGYYHLVSCYVMFVLDEPGHPVGMPFPGGFKVEKRPDGYYCPIRDKEKDVPYSICNFCPAKQSELPQ